MERQQHWCRARVMALRGAWLAAGLALAAGAAQANNIRVANVTLKHTDKKSGTVAVQFNLSWENSWRDAWVETNTGYGDAAVSNWDAAWVFIKWRNAGTNWNHARLAAAGHTAPDGVAIDLGGNGGATNVGAFIHRAANGSGALNLSGVQLRWNYAAAGLALTNVIDISVHAIEMVYIPQGPFWLGSGAAPATPGESGSFTEGAWTSGATIPFRVASEAALTISNAAGCLWGTSASGNNTIGPAGVLSNAFPKGYKAFYCMKYEVTQGQYTEFLNRLSASQAAARFIGNTGTYRQTIGTNAAGVYTNGAPDYSLHFMSYADGAAYADWAGLRPMTELEFEKACRGPKAPVANEMAWGDATVRYITSIAGTDGSGTETALPTNANYNYQVPLGPVRAGIYATANSTRAKAGAGYYGVMELSSIGYEPAVTVGNATGRAFEGTHGDGILDAGGNADALSWPAANGTGAGRRGGAWDTSIWANNIYTSSRTMASQTYAARWYMNGARAVRTAP